MEIVLNRARRKIAMAKISEAEINGLLEKCSNWGRWGKDDERGALNYIDDSKTGGSSEAGTKRRSCFAVVAAGDAPGARQSDAGDAFGAALRT
jgi:hypothetical protein